MSYEHLGTLKTNAKLSICVLLKSLHYLQEWDIKNVDMRANEYFSIISNMTCVIKNIHLDNIFLVIYNKDSWF